MPYYFSKTLKTNFEDAVNRTIEALKKERSIPPRPCRPSAIRSWRKSRTE